MGTRDLLDVDNEGPRWRSIQRDQLQLSHGSSIGESIETTHPLQAVISMDALDELAKGLDEVLVVIVASIVHLLGPNKGTQHSR